MTTVEHRFTFGTSHTTTFDLPRGGSLADYWVTVALPLGSPLSHREVFIQHFTEPHCPHPSQFAFEYRDGFQERYFPKGELIRITEEGVVI